MSYHGDIRLGDTIDIKFVTTAAATGAPTTLSGSPVVSAYVGNSTTEITAGITLTVDFDARTGLNNVRVVASGGNGFTTNTNVQLVITAGTVGGTSAVGYVVGTFSIEARSALMPTTGGRTLDVSTTGEAGLDVSNISALPAGAVPQLGIAEGGTMQAGSTSTTAVLRAATSFADDNPLGWTIWITGGTGVGQSRFISDWVSATDTATVSVAWQTTPDNTSTYVVFPTALASASGGSLTAADVWTYVTRTLTAPTNLTSTNAVIPITGGRVDASVGAYQTGLTPLQPTVAGRTLDVTATGEAGMDWANIGSPTTTVNFSGTTISAVSGAVGSVTGSVNGNVVGTVGSVTGNVGGNVLGNVVGSVGSVASNVTVAGLTFTVAGLLDVNVRRINSFTVQGDGTSLNLWRG